MKSATAKQIAPNEPELPPATPQPPLRRRPSDYTATSRRAVERALAAAPRRILCGPPPKKPSHRWIRAYEARALAAGRHYS